MINHLITANGLEESPDSREFERYEIEVPVEMQYIDAAGVKKKLLLQAANLSAGGAFFKSMPSLPEGTEVELGIFLLFRDPENPRDTGQMVVITVTGTIQRSTREGTAVCFKQDYEISGLPAQ